jgi:hypothetical protein
MMVFAATNKEQEKEVNYLGHWAAAQQVMWAGRT